MGNRSWIWHAGVTLVCGALVGWANLHTDEVTVVLAIEIVVSFACGVLTTRNGWAAGLVIGACVPASQYLALICGWRTPYPNSLRSIPQSFIAVPPAMLFGWIGGLIRQALT